MSSKICETIQNTSAAQATGPLQDLDLSLKTKMNSEQQVSQELLVAPQKIGSAVSETAPLGERLLSNFDNQTNVKISNQKSNCSNEQANKPKDDSEKASSDSSLAKMAGQVSDFANLENISTQEDGPGQKSEAKGNSKTIQKPQQKKKMDKSSKNKLFDKENISYDALTEITQTNQIPITLKEDKVFEAQPSTEESEPFNVTEGKQVLEQQQNHNDQPSEMSTKTSMHGGSSENSFQQTLSTESMNAATASSEISRIEEQIMQALEQIKSKQMVGASSEVNQTTNEPAGKAIADKQKLIGEQIATAKQLVVSDFRQELVDDTQYEDQIAINQKAEDILIKDKEGDIENTETQVSTSKEEKPGAADQAPHSKSSKYPVVVDKEPSAAIEAHKVVDSSQIDELTESIVDDLIKNAFKPEPVNIEKDEETSSEAQKREDKLTLEQEYLELGDEEDNLNIRETFKDQELSKEDAEHIKSPVKSRPNDDKLSSDGEQSQEEEEYMELGYQNINNVLYIDTKVMNFGTFMPGGKLLGSNLMIQNITKCEQIIELSVDSSSFRYKINDLTTLFPTIQQNCTKKKNKSPKNGGQQTVAKEEEKQTVAGGKSAVLPFEIENLKQSDNQSKSNFIKNSEYIHEAWFIENPVSRELTKRITLKLGPMAQQDFIIVNRSPLQIKRTENMLSIINVGLLTYKGEQFGVKHSFENFLKYQYNNDMKLFLADRKELSQIQRMKVLLAGKVQNPKISCIKEIFLEDHGLRVMPLAVKKGFQQQIQRFKIPFKNTTSMDMEVEFQFMKTSAVINPASDQLPGATNSPEESKVPIIKKGNMMQSLMASPLELAAQPQTMKICGNQQIILNISARLKNSYLMQQKELENSSTLTEKQKQKTLKAMAKERFHHLLVARVKDTNMMFSYLFQVQLLQQEAQVQVSQQARQMAGITPKAD